ncbi:assimilatory nitrate reductase catalytic subunit [Naumannella cuiyingiana]|uniref:Assimilatory nitrate reductase catalytic subunit n=1 Tax=Naumannella cuiyingiana TaxID=1347891 RepID=A0A7Z0D844_9ACTN|nr:molybdopterin oxidoreductase family protein [Naumannella cuiyingiana]NYI70575.1 assimilatory nitrate reductase catalytic subunit [Naumannella cuiyingiana]
MTDTHCPYCALQCAITLTVDETGGNRTVSVAPRDFPTNLGGLCQKGWTAATLLDHPDRLTTPLVRRDGALVPASWDEAYAVIIERVRRVQDESGRDAVAVFGGGGLTNEKAYLLGKFARLALGTSMIDYNGRFCMSSAAAAGNRAFGLDRGLPFPLADLGGADAVLLAGSNLAATMPPAVRHLASIRERGGLIAIDPRRSETARLTDDGAGIHLRNLPGSDLAVLLGLLQVIIAEDRCDEDYLASRTTGWPRVRAAAAQWWPERVERASGVPADALRQAARLLAAASPARGGAGAYLLTGRGAEQHAHGTDTVTAVINLALALGLPGRAGSGYGAITGQGNGQGGREHGQKNDQLPGYRKITDHAAREHVASVWGVAPETIPGPGVPAVQLLRSLGTPGGPRALFVHGANPVISGPDAQVITERLAALDLLVVCDFFRSETAELADVVLPVTQWAEETGTMTSLEGRVLRRRRAVPPPEGVRDELRVLADLAGRLGCRADFPTDPDAVLAELGRASAGGIADYGGITPERLDRGEALHWPCPADDHPGTPRLFAERFATPDGRAAMIAVEPAPVDDDLRPDAPIYLITGRVLQQYQSGAQTRRVAALNRVQGSGFVELHPRLARRLEVAEGELVRVRSARGEACAPARISADLRPDVVFMPFHFPGQERANTLTNPTTDPVSGMPEFKVCAVEVTKIKEAAC